jgi:battenin
LTYQTFVFISRSSHLLRIPPLPRSLLPLPAILQAVVLTLLLLESTRSNGNGGFGFLQVGGVLLLICVEGCCGGSAYVNTFHHVGLEGLGSENIAGKDERKRVEEREFRIASVGAADSLGILFASLLSMPLELAICQTQVDVGRDLCRTL